MNFTRQLTLMRYVFVLAITVSCNNNSSVKKPPAIDILVNVKDSTNHSPTSFIIIPNSSRFDTVNLTDKNGKRQGNWFPHPSNGLKDTVYYKDGIIQKQ